MKRRKEIVVRMIISVVKVGFGYDDAMLRLFLIWFGWVGLHRFLKLVDLLLLRLLGFVLFCVWNSKNAYLLSSFVVFNVVLYLTSYLIVYAYGMSYGKSNTVSFSLP
jgi:hypothetical protein